VTSKLIEFEEEKDRILKEILRLLGEKYPVGLYEYLYEHNRGTYEAIIRVEDKVDQAFLFGTVEELKAVLRDYWKLHMEGIKQFKQAGGICFNQTLARKKLEEERVRA
jgi:hypothetical protein